MTLPPSVNLPRRRMDSDREVTRLFAHVAANPSTPIPPPYLSDGEVQRSQPMARRYSICVKDSEKFCNAKECMAKFCMQRFYMQRFYSAK